MVGNLSLFSYKEEGDSTRTCVSANNRTNVSDKLGFCAKFFFNNISKLYNELPEDYVIIVTADHGGHDRTHGTELDEDMIIPMMVLSKKENASFNFENASIKDVAPTVATLLGVSPDEEWEGKSLLK